MRVVSIFSSNSQKKAKKCICHKFQMSIVCHISFAHFLKTSCVYLLFYYYLPNDSLPFRNPSQMRRAIRSSWHKMSGLSWINFNFRSQHFTFDRWKLVSLTEINLKRSLSRINLNLLGDIITYIYSRLATYEIKMIHTFITKSRNQRTCLES